MWKLKSYHVLFLIALLCGAFAIHGAAQAGAGPLTPYQKAVLDLYYFQLAQQISGTNITPGTLPIEALSFTVITNEVDPNLTIFIATIWIGHTNNSSAHHIRFANSEETDQVFTNWLDTTNPVVIEKDPVFTNLHGVSGVFTQVIGSATTRYFWAQGVCTQIMTNATVVLP